MGTHGRRGVARLVVGSGAESILRHASVPVLLVRAASEPVRQQETTAGKAAHLGVSVGTVAMQ